MFHSMWRTSVIEPCQKHRKYQHKHAHTHIHCQWKFSFLLYFEDIFLHSPILMVTFAFPLLSLSSKTHALQTSFDETNPHSLQFIFVGIFTVALIVIYSAEWIMSIIDVGLTFSKSLISSLTYPRYAFGE